MPSHDKLRPVRVEPAMYQVLEIKAKKAGSTITAEVRERLAKSMEEDADDARDPATGKLVRDVKALLVQLALDTDGPWHRDPFAFAAARAGVLALLDAAKPEGEIKPPSGTAGLFGITDPSTLGVAHARLVLRNQPTGGANG